MPIWKSLKEYLSSCQCQLPLIGIFKFSLLLYIVYIIIVYYWLFFKTNRYFFCNKKCIVDPWKMLGGQLTPSPTTHHWKSMYTFWLPQNWSCFSEPMRGLGVEPCRYHTLQTLRHPVRNGVHNASRWPSASADSRLLMENGTAMYWKKTMYKFICEVQSCVVRRSPVNII